MPLLATLDKLSTHGYLDELLSMRNGEFVDNLLTNLSDEAKGCTDVKRLLAIVGVALNLLQPDLQTIDLVRNRIYLCHFLFVMTFFRSQYNTTAIHATNAF
jgi:hypothetical protein